MSGPKLDVVVTGIRQLTPRIREYLLSSKDRSPLPRNEPGSHIEVHVSMQAGGTIPRHYSLIGGLGTWDDPASTYRIAVQRGTGRGSNSIHDVVTLGTEMKVSVPMNNFPLDRTDRRSLLIAGGIGITPIYSMLRSLVRRGKPFSLFYAGRSHHELAYREDVLRLAGPSGQLFLSGDPPTRHPDLKALLADQPPGTIAYVCGPGPMIQATRDAAAALGWPEDRVRSELFGSGPGIDAVLFGVELRRTGRLIEVSQDTTILDAIEAAGIAVLADCRRGECGLCPLPVLAADGPIQHRDRYLSEADRTAGKTLCICVSRLNGGRLVLDA